MGASHAEVLEQSFLDLAPDSEVVKSVRASLVCLLRTQACARLRLSTSARTGHGHSARPLVLRQRDAFDGPAAGRCVTRLLPRRILVSWTCAQARTRRSTTDPARSAWQFWPSRSRRGGAPVPAALRSQCRRARGLQTLLEHAFKFKNIQRIVYSTCSVYCEVGQRAGSRDCCGDPHTGERGCGCSGAAGRTRRGVQACRGAAELAAARMDASPGC